MTDSLLVLLLLSFLGLAGLEGIGETADITLCKLGSMTDGNAIYPEDLLDLCGEVSERLTLWNHTNSLDKLLIF